MTYSILIEKRQGYSEYFNGLRTWAEVTDKLRNGLPQEAIRAHIYKFSSNNKTIGNCIVTMSNIVKVINALKDKEVLR